MKDSNGVIDNGWSNNGLRRPGAICFALHGASRAQGTGKLIAESKNRGKGLKVKSLFNEYKKEGKKEQRPMTT